MIRILQCVNRMDRAGLETMLMNYYRNIDRSEVQFDFLTHRSDNGAYDEEIKKLGGVVYHAPRLVPGNYIKYFIYMKKFFRNHPEYKIVHSHIDFMSFFPLLAAKMNNIKIRIAHCHTSKLDLDFKLPIKFFGKINMKKVATHYFACGEVAGKYMYGKDDFTIINNAIDVEKFKYNEDVRNKLRRDFNISEDQVVIGNVGRYIYIKNQEFLIKLMNQLNDKKYVLLLIGQGEDEIKLKKMVSSYNLDNNVIFLSNRSDVNELYSMMDIFAMPSLFEGLPLVSIEAQSNGLYCLFSNGISKEVMITPSAKMIDLKELDKWISLIKEYDKKRYQNNLYLVRKNGFDIKIEANKLINKYYDYLK